MIMHWTLVFPSRFHNLNHIDGPTLPAPPDTHFPSPPPPPYASPQSCTLTPVTQALPHPRHSPGLTRLEGM